MAILCGVDEAGRGPIAGPVYAAAVVLDPNQAIRGLDDSKRLSERRREELAAIIVTQAAGFAVAQASVAEIDTLNILQASLLAMRRAVLEIKVAFDEAWIDGPYVPVLNCRAIPLVGGDRLMPEISAASILAKTARDAEMRRLHLLYPEYRLDRHKGYATQEHLRLIDQYGPCDAHRRSVAPVRRALAARTRNLGETAQ